MAKRVPVREMMGRVSSRVRAIYSQLTVDWTQVDYPWWNKLFRGKQPGYELGGLFADPIARVQSDWTLGKGFTATTGHEATDEALAEFIADNLDTLNDWDYQAFSLADGYLGVNPDGTLTLIPPNMVEKIVNKMNPADVWGYKVTSRPDESVEIIDEYRVQPTPGRHLVVKEQGRVTLDETYALLSDDLPIIHIANGREPNEIYGHSGVESLRRLFAEYDDVITKSLQGVKLMGNPVPVIEDAEDPERELDLNATDEITEVTPTEGVSITRKVIDFARQGLFLVLGKGAKFAFKSPGSFTQDAGRMLEYLFLLMLQRSRIPEWVWGGAVASSKASVDAQMPAFALFIESRQRKLETHIKKLLTVWLQVKRLTTPGIQADLPIAIDWPGVTQRDETITLTWAQTLYDRSLITAETFVRLSGLIDNPADEVAAAQDEQQQKQATEEAITQEVINRLSAQRFNPDMQTDQTADQQQLEAAA